MRHVVLSLLLLSTPWIGLAAELTDAEVRELLIRRSIASYSGNCPCPYNLDRAGRRCGARSAYSKPGGDAPLCFVEDVTPPMIAAFKAKTE